MPRKTRRGEHDLEATERQGMSTEVQEVDGSETMASTGADLDEGDLEFFEEDQPEEGED